MSDLQLAYAPGPLNFSSSKPLSAGTGPSTALRGAVLHTCRLLFAASKKSELDVDFRKLGVLDVVLHLIKVERPKASADGSQPARSKQP